MARGEIQATGKPKFSADPRITITRKPSIADWGVKLLQPSRAHTDGWRSEGEAILLFSARRAFCVASGGAAGP
jgi:hypothetical protein